MGCGSAESIDSLIPGGLAMGVGRSSESSGHAEGEAVDAVGILGQVDMVPMRAVSSRWPLRRQRASYSRMERRRMIADRLPRTSWLKSTYSGSGDNINCVEVKVLPVCQDEGRSKSDDR